MSLMTLSLMKIFNFQHLRYKILPNQLSIKISQRQIADDKMALKIQNRLQLGLVSEHRETIHRMNGGKSP